MSISSTRFYIELEPFTAPAAARPGDFLLSDYWERLDQADRCWDYIDIDLFMGDGYAK